MDYFGIDATEFCVGDSARFLKGFGDLEARGLKSARFLYGDVCKPLPPAEAVAGGPPGPRRAQGLVCIEPRGGALWG